MRRSSAAQVSALLIYQAPACSTDLLAIFHCCPDECAAVVLPYAASCDADASAAAVEHRQLRWECKATAAIRQLETAVPAAGGLNDNAACPGPGGQNLNGESDLPRFLLHFTLHFVQVLLDLTLFPSFLRDPGGLRS